MECGVFGMSFSANNLICKHSRLDNLMYSLASVWVAAEYVSCSLNKVQECQVFLCEYEYYSAQ